MARGWESKAIEDQINERDVEARKADADAAKLTDDARERQSQLRSLKLSRTRIVNQLATATRPAHRTMLERALATLDTQIAEADEASAPE